MLTEEAPKITDWMQAWGSLAGLVMSTVAVIFAGLLFRHEKRVRREEKADAEEAQARLVVATFTGLRRAMNDDSEYTHAAYSVVNFSAAPVLSLELRHVYQGFGLTWPSRLQILRGEVKGSLALFDPLPEPEGNRLAPRIDLEITFTDSNGFDWKRTGGARPARVLPMDASMLSLRQMRTVLLTAGSIAVVVGFLIGFLLH
ncbi:hypothetical protein O7602_11570 [Micromonospora sp. WMMD1128]|uniref:hypothetical protein n=1 Tax=Micromonospora sp. WMMD1128 TaxID=3015150 RepID=UPI00248B1CB2|nr:hypothetical protein [Micromonospora sp. WMMD1128]WBB76112.1 hypothetical protein O7602_11570 [Micromonospora sp. WMMD1128]